MQLIPLKSPFIKPNDNLLAIILSVLAKHHQTLQNTDILVITSKVVSLSENRIVSLKQQKLSSFVKQEADFIFSKGKFALTYIHGLLIPNAGIDQSNIGKGQAILYPKHPQKSADKLRLSLKKHFHLKDFGLIITDSHCQPLRSGVTGLALVYSGFIGLEDCRGKMDLFNKKLKVTKRNLADSLAAAANILMGEAAERLPFVIIRRAPVRFTNKIIDSKKAMSISPNKCLFRPLYPKKFVAK